MLNNNKNDTTLKEIKALSEYLGLNEYVIEKDLFVTQAISIVSKISHEHYDLVFQGGTSLAKAHKIIGRMSEDCDFRIRFKNPERNFSKEFKRKTLRQFRHELIHTLRNNNFEIDESDIRVRNEGKFMGIRAHYPSTFPHIETMKPYIALDFFMADVRIAPEIKQVTTLIKQIFGDKIDHPEFPVNSVAIIETAAEKWVALTRRIASSVHRESYFDPTLVRHIYDIYQIQKKNFFVIEPFEKLVNEIVHVDRLQYKNHNADYYQNPCEEIRNSLNELRANAQWQQHWEKFVDSMVFDNQTPEYEAVLVTLEKISSIALSALGKTDFNLVTIDN